MINPSMDEAPGPPFSQTTKGDSRGSARTASQRLKFYFEIWNEKKLVRALTRRRFGVEKNSLEYIYLDGLLIQYILSGKEGSLGAPGRLYWNDNSPLL